MLLNCHLVAFCTVHLDFKKQPNDNLLTFVYEAIFALVYYTVASYSWLQTALTNVASIHLAKNSYQSLIVLASCFNRFIMVNILIYLILQNRDSLTLPYL